MKEIVIMASPEGVYPAIAETLRSLFPECKIRVVGAGGIILENMSPAINRLSSPHHCGSPFYLCSK